MPKRQREQEGKTEREREREREKERGGGTGAGSAHTFPSAPADKVAASQSALCACVSYLRLPSCHVPAGQEKVETLSESNIICNCRRHAWRIERPGDRGKKLAKRADLCADPGCFYPVHRFPSRPYLFCPRTESGPKGYRTCISLIFIDPTPDRSCPRDSPSQTQLARGAVPALAGQEDQCERE